MSEHTGKRCNHMRVYLSKNMPNYMVEYIDFAIE